MSPHFAADVSLLLSATAQLVVQGLLDANKFSQCCTVSSLSFLQLDSVA